MLEVVVVETLLVKCWNQLEISDDSSMAAYKLDGRTEELSWNPPFFSFDIERHGGVDMEAKDAVIYSYEVNVEEGTAMGVERL